MEPNDGGGWELILPFQLGDFEVNQPFIFRGVWLKTLIQNLGLQPHSLPPFILEFPGKVYHLERIDGDNSYVLFFHDPLLFVSFWECLVICFHHRVSLWDDQIDCFTYRRSTSATRVAKSLMGDFRQRRYDVVYRRFGATWLEDFLHKVGTCQQLWGGVHIST